MKITCHCSSCGLDFELDRRFAGRKAHCPICSAAVMIARSADSREGPAESQPVAPPRQTSGGEEDEPITGFIRLEPLDSQSEDEPETDSVEMEALAPILEDEPDADSPQDEASAVLLEDAPETGFPQLGTAGPASDDVRFRRTRPAPGKSIERKQVLQLAAIISACFLAVSLVVALVVVLIVRSGDPKQPTAEDQKPAKPTMLEIAWDESSRDGGVAYINNEKHEPPPTGPVRFPLLSGKNLVRLQRRGFEMIEFTHDFVRGETYVCTPSWKRITPPTVARTDDPFEQWRQRFVAAEEDLTRVPSTVVQFNEWLKSNSFELPDLRPRLQLEAARLLFQTGQRDAAMKQMDAFDEWMKSHQFGDMGIAASLHLDAVKLLFAVREQEAAKQQCRQGLADASADPLTRQVLTEGLRLMEQHPGIVSSGTGFFVFPGGYLLTNHHVIADAKKVTVTLYEQEGNVPAEIVATDAEADMALLKIEVPEGVKIKPLRLAKSEVQRQQEVCVLGYPHLSTSANMLVATKGIVSATQNEEGMITTDAAVNPGNSGGPLFNVYGAVVGMVTQKHTSYGLAIPADKLQTFLEKHIPEFGNQLYEVTAESELKWEELDRLFAPSVVMIQNIQ
ncbi:MAG TPA: S1C family serine protease [Thermoguttaceae bacterium]|nr:S1C family serine protease [Thermoguttaceae bacterium]